MHNNFNLILNRIHDKNQVIHANSNNLLQSVEVKKIESPVIPPDVLFKKLSERLNPIPTTKLEESSNTEPETKSIFLVHFMNIFEFTGWYEKNKQSFSEIQQKALDTLIGARDGTIGGCNCTRERRKMIADDYFHKFWINNKKTDLPPTLLKNLKAKKFILGDFFTFPE